jgi:hypothetical protein
MNLLFKRHLFPSKLRCCLFLTVSHTNTGGLTMVTCRDLYAFHNKEKYSLRSELHGWPLYQIDQEFERQRLDSSKWRITQANEGDYKAHPHLPSRFVVPASVSDGCSLPPPSTHIPFIHRLTRCIPHILPNHAHCRDAGGAGGRRVVQGAALGHCALLGPHEAGVGAPWLPPARGQDYEPGEPHSHVAAGIAVFQGPHVRPGRREGRQACARGRDRRRRRRQQAHDRQR